MPSSGQNTSSFQSNTMQTGEQTGQVDFASAGEIDTAVASSKKAFDEWGTVSKSDRLIDVLAKL